MSEQIDISKVKWDEEEPIDISKVQWDKEEPIDTSKVQWDNPLDQAPGATIGMPHKPFADLPKIQQSTPGVLGVGEDALYDYNSQAVKEMWANTTAPLRKRLSNFLDTVLPGAVKTTKDQERSKAFAAVALADVFNIPVTDAYDNQDILLEKIGLKQGPQNAPEFALDLATNPMVMAAGATVGFGALTAAGQTSLQAAGHIAKGIGEFMLLQEGVRVGVAALEKDIDYAPMQSEGFSGLLPEQASKFSKDFVDLLEFIALGGAAAGIEAKSAKIIEALTRKTIVDHKLPETLFIPADRVREVITSSTFTEGTKAPVEGGVLQTKPGKGMVKGLTPEEYDFVVQVLDGDATLYRQAVKNGLEIEVPAEKITTVVDRPYWAKLKEFFNLSPNAETTRIYAADPRIKFKGLPSPEDAAKLEAERIGAIKVEKPSTLEVPTADIEAVNMAVAHGESEGVSDRLISKTVRGWLTGMRTGEWPEIPLPKGMTEWIGALRRGDTGRIKLNWLLVDAQDLPFTAYAAGDAAAIKSAKSLITEAYKEGEKSAKQKAQEKHAAEIDKLVDSYEARLGKAKDKLDTVKIRAELKRTQQALQEYTHKLIKRITKLPTQNTDFAYKQAIEEIQAMYLPENWKDAAKTDAIRRFLEEHPEVKDKLTPATIKRLEERGSAAQQTIADLEAIHDSVMALSQEGKKVYADKLAERNRRFIAVKKAILGALKGKAQIPGMVTKASSKQKSLKGAAKQGKIGMADSEGLRPNRIFDMVDGGKASFSGPAHRLFIDKTNDLLDKKMRMVDNRKQAFTEFLKQLGVKIQSLAKTQIVDGHEFTYDEMIGVYGLWQNPHGRLAAIGNLMRLVADTEADAAAIATRLGERIIRQLDENGKKIADWIIEENDGNFPRTREVAIRYTNNDVPKESRYMALVRTDPNTGEGVHEVANVLLHRENLRKAYPGKGMIKARKDIPLEYQTPIKLGAVEVWLQQVEAQEHFIHLAEHVRDMQRLVGDKELSETITAKIGAPYMEQIRDYVNRVGDPNIFKAYKLLDRISQTVRRNSYTAMLAFSTKTILNQTAGLPLYLADAGPKHFFAVWGEFIRNPKETFQFVIENDMFIKHRSVLREFEELAVATKGLNPTKEALNSLGAKLTIGIDRLVTVIGWKAVYNRAIADGLSKEEATQLARNATLRTQSVSNAHMLPGVMTRNELFNWMMFMQNQNNQLWNIVRYDIPHKISAGEYKYAFWSAVGLVIAAGMIDVFAEHTYSFGRSIVNQTVGSIPLAGTFLTSESRQRSIIPFDMLKKAKAVGTDVVNADVDEDTLDDLWWLAATSWGLPYTGAKRIGKAVLEGDPVEVIGKPYKK